jgi:hypothetical protein
VSLPRHLGPPWLESHTSGRTTSKGEDQSDASFSDWTINLSWAALSSSRDFASSCVRSERLGSQGVILFRTKRCKASRSAWQKSGWRATTPCGRRARTVRRSCWRSAVSLRKSPFVRPPATTNGVPRAPEGHVGATAEKPCHGSNLLRTMARHYSDAWPRFSEHIIT